MHEPVGILHIYSYQVRSAVVRQCAEFASMIFSFPDHPTVHTDKKDYKLFLIYKEMNADRIRCKVIYDWRPPHIWLIICAFPQILWSPSSYIYDFAPDPIWISLHTRTIFFSFYWCSKLHYILFLNKRVSFHKKHNIFYNIPDGLQNRMLVLCTVRLKWVKNKIYFLICFDASPPTVSTIVES